jgi:hypothetical protein
MLGFGDVVNIAAVAHDAKRSVSSMSRAEQIVPQSVAHCGSGLRKSVEPMRTADALGIGMVGPVSDREPRSVGF